MTRIRYSAACCQTNFPSPKDRTGICRNVDGMLEMVDWAVTGYQPFLPVRLLVFPEFAHSAPIYPTVEELSEKLAVPIPNEHTDRYEEKAAELDVYIQTGSFIESDDRYPGALFNTTCLIGPEGILYRYRKVHPWIPWEVHASPHDIEGYDEDPFPVAETSIGRIGVATCYDWLFPEVTRQLAANGAEILVRISAYMDPWGHTPPMDWWTVINRARAIENVAYVVACNQGASLENYPPFSWDGGSMVVDYNGRILSQTGDGQKILVSDVDIDALRHERCTREGHQPLAHLRTEMLSLYRQGLYPSGASTDGPITLRSNSDRIREVKGKLGYT